MPVMRGSYNRAMSYQVTLGCSCRVYVSVHPRTDVAHTRVIESRGDACRDRHHDIGARLGICELPLEDRSQQAVIDDQHARASAPPGPSAWRAEAARER